VEVSCNAGRQLLVENGLGLGFGRRHEGRVLS
jgi:hypothetical protein